MTNNGQEKQNTHLVEHYGTEVQEVLSAPPSWIVRRGIGVIALVILILVGISYFVRYPDIIRSEITITSFNTPADLKSRSSGRLTLFYPENRQIKRDEVAGYISNASDFEDVKKLKHYLSDVKRCIAEDKQFSRLTIPSGLVLGELEEPFLTHVGALHEYGMFRELNSYSKNVTELKQQIAIYEQLGIELLNQKRVTAEELDLAARKLRADSLLFSQNVIAKLDLQNALSNYLPYKKALDQTEYSILLNNLRQAEMRGKLMELTLGKSETLTRLESRITITYNSLISAIRIWEERYTLIAPIDGQISYFRFWNNNQYVEAGETVLTIVPSLNDLFGFMIMPMKGSGKVKVGQRVNIRLDNYPFNEFGILRGEVSSISTVPQNNSYAVTVRLTDGLQTTHGVNLTFQEQMKGAGEVITEDYRLIERFFYQLNKLLKNR